MAYYMGIDIGSTTVKVVVMDEDGQIKFKRYERHYSKVREKTIEVLNELDDTLKACAYHVAITGSAGFGVAKICGIDFVQEVFATAGAVEHFAPDTDAVVELGGEDAKIIFFGTTLEERMNGSCAGGTGAFIDQMATLLGVTVQEMDALYDGHQRLYAIASRCGVFAKSDIQPLLNQGAKKEDLAASIFQAVVDQTIAGLAQGRKIEGKVMFLGGPLTFLHGLRERFVKTLKLTDEQARFPENGEYFIAMGAGLYAAKSEEKPFADILDGFVSASGEVSVANTLEPLFTSEEDYAAFQARHAKNTVKKVDIAAYQGDAYLGIDAGSTTTKMALIAENGDILFDYYTGNQGNPVHIVKQQLEKIYQLCGDRIHIRSTAATGYGEDLVKNAFHLDHGVVETVAHFYGAKFFDPEVEFILDIGGQDMKCFKIKNGAIHSIMLNEACSSGCGSFIETFAKALGYTTPDFARIGLFSKHPVDLGSRCTVFMNSSVKQAQKEGAGVDDISAGLSMSVVKNALYKVIRIADPEELGTHIVVQGGTFLNDAVLRSFEMELGKPVTRPGIAGIMGAFGAAIYARELAAGQSQMITADELEHFEHTSSVTQCGLCTNRCTLTVNNFSGGRRFISGNKCERPLGIKAKADVPNMYRYKYEKLCACLADQQLPDAKAVIGIPMVLNMYENLPFWVAFFNRLGYLVKTASQTNRALYQKGQDTIPSDTVCYPAKIAHGHVVELVEQGVDYLFYPCMTFNFEESSYADNHYNCPVVAYYPELLDANVKALEQVKYLNPYFGLHKPKEFEKKAFDYFGPRFGVSKKEIAAATAAAYAAYHDYEADVRREGERAIEYARSHGMDMIVLAGRPYHVDPGINHGIDRMIASFGVAVLSEDAVSWRAERKRAGVLNQWTYHARLYNAAQYITEQEDMEIIQLVSFGCGIDAITTDEVREIMEGAGRVYTQIKIDEISNLGAARIRVRSLLAVMKDVRAKRKKKRAALA